MATQRKGKMTFEELDNLNDNVTSNTSKLNNITNEWNSWVPTITWPSGIVPIGMTTIAIYKQIGKTVFFNIGITATNGNNAGNASTYITLPISAKPNNAIPAVSITAYVGVTPVGRYGYIRDDGINDDIRAYPPTLISGNTVQLSISGFYEVN